jgi:hypothetical protein
VVPLAAIIRHLLKNPALFQNCQDLERFLRDHLVMAHIPRNLDRRLKAEAMPPAYAEQWHRPSDGSWSNEEKRAAFWGRYREKNVRLHWEAGNLWTEVSAAWEVSRMSES